MNTLIRFIIISSLFFFLPTQLIAGNLSLIEKRLKELDQLNKEAIQQAGTMPKDGSISINATVKPGVILPQKTSGIVDKQFSFGKKEILALDKKFTHSVQISSSRSKAQCYRVAAMMRKAGYPAFTASINLQDSGVWYRIFVGSYATESEAQATIKELVEDKISDGFIRIMPYAVQVGDAAPASQLQTLRQKVSALQYMPYTSYVRDTTTNKTKARLLVGAFTKKEHTKYLLNDLRQAGFQARVVTR